MFLSAVFVLAAVPAAGQETRQCSVASVTGTAHVIAAGTERSVTLDMPIGDDEVVRTSPDGRIEIVCSDGITVSIGIATSIRLERLVGRASQRRGVLIRLIEGIAGFIAPSKTFPSFNVETQSAVAAVRSTEWLIETVGGATSVFAREGRVEVAPVAGEAVVLAAGEGVDVGADGKAAPVKAWGAARINDAGERIGSSWR